MGQGRWGVGGGRVFVHGWLKKKTFHSRGIQTRTGVGSWGGGGLGGI